MQFICKYFKHQSDSVPKFGTKFSIADKKFGLVRCGYVNAANAKRIKTA